MKPFHVENMVARLGMDLTIFFWGTYNELKGKGEGEGGKGGKVSPKFKYQPFKRIERFS